MITRILSVLVCLHCFICCTGSAATQAKQKRFRIPDEPPSHWEVMAQLDLQRATELYKNIKNHRAKNAILFLGDGMGISTITAGRILKGQLVGNSGDEALLQFERYPHTALAKTYNTDKQTPDSAGTATAYLCGVKAMSGTMGVNGLVKQKNCSSLVEKNFVYSFLTDAQKQGKSVGIVTTTRITHATPGAAYAHTAWRDWESDEDRNKEVRNLLERPNCPDTAQQMVDYAINYTVIFGGGRVKFLPKSEKTADEVTKKYIQGQRNDSVNLLKQWKLRQESLSRRANYLETRQELLDIKPGQHDVYLGLFAPNHLNFVLDNVGNKEPSLEEMTRKAIEILKLNPKGFALLVEGGRIDHGHHMNLAKKALHEVVELDKAVKTAENITDENETLTVVTADHSHVFTIGGWADRGISVFGKVEGNTEAPNNTLGMSLASDGKPYTSLLYGNGPSGLINQSRPNVTNVDTGAANYTQLAAVKLKYESHGAEDVPIYAKGPGAHLFHTTHEQSYVAHVIKYALCVGSYQKGPSHCKT